MNTHLIYAFVDEYRCPFYIGKTKNLKNRMRGHIRQLKNGNMLPNYNKMRKLLGLDYKNINNYIIIIESNIPTDSINEREIFYIRYYRELNVDLKNLTDGGDGDSNPLPETIAKRVASNTGKKRSIESKRNISESKMGMIFSESHKANLSKSWDYNKHFSPEINMKISNTSTGKVNIKKYMCISPEGIEHITDRGLTQFCKENGLLQPLMSKVALGQRSHHKGWKCYLI